MKDFQGISIFPSLLESYLPIQNPLSIDAELWLLAEHRVQEILYIIRPNLVADKKREELLVHLQRLIKRYCGTEVFAFGSVPLKTYLPDGDIDLTALCHPSMEDRLAKSVRLILEGEERDPEFRVIDIQYVRAQVQIVKCCIKGLAVDISFNQIAGISTVCFLEQVDEFIGRNHLFKRSIILIKAWCFYESRILGAHYSLLSAYALETMILYIINRFHPLLCGPLAVLYKFLEYYANFDWENYCVSINGPVPKSSLPDIVVETQDNEGDNLLLCEEFLRNCREMFSVSTLGPESRCHEFPIKHLNIIDPLKDNNNLGRSVGKGNCYRIKCAFAYGARKLKSVLVKPGEDMCEGIEHFFQCTLERNGMGLRPDAEVPVPAFGTGRFAESELTGDYEKNYNSLLYSQWYHYSLCQNNPPSSPSMILKGSAMTRLFQSLHCNENFLYRGRTNVFVPKVPFCCPDNSRLPATTCGPEEIWKSKGTGTYIPNMIRRSYRGMHSITKARNPGATRSINQRHSKKSDQTEESESEKGTDNVCIDLSVKEFPLLPGIRTPEPSESDLSCPDSENSPQLKRSFAHMGPIEFGSLGQASPEELASLIAKKLLISVGSTFLDSRCNCPSSGTQKKEEMVDGNAESSGSYQLEDDNASPNSSS